MRPWKRFNELSKDQIHSYTILWNCDLEVNLLMAFRVLRNFGNICSTLCHHERFNWERSFQANKKPAEVFSLSLSADFYAAGNSLPAT